MKLETLWVLLLACVLLGGLLGCSSAGVFDFDSDGVPDAQDCAPEDSTIHPGAEDPYGDGIDQNCDGYDGVDFDGDSFANNATDSSYDCNDGDPEIHPDAEEVEDNDVDEDCDGCKAGLTPVQSLYITAIDQDAGGLQDYDWNSVAGDVEVAETVNLRDLSLLRCLEEVGGYIKVRDNASLSSLDGLERLRVVGGSIKFDNNPDLSNVEAVGSLWGVGGDLVFTNNASLEELRWAAPLTNLGGILEVKGNLVLTAMPGLSALEQIDQSLWIEANPALHTLDLVGLRGVGQDFVITGNSALPTAEAEALLEQVNTADGVGGDLIVLCGNEGGEPCLDDD